MEEKRLGWRKLLRIFHLGVTCLLLMGIGSMYYADQKKEEKIMLQTTELQLYAQALEVSQGVLDTTLNALRSEVLNLAENTPKNMYAGYPFKEQTYITSPIGKRLNPFTMKSVAEHHGVDISTRVWKAEILSPVTGKVITHYPPPGGKYKGHKVYGGMVEVQEEDGTVWLMAHMSETYVHEGMKVKKGERIGRMGMTGQCTAMHLHLERKVYAGEHVIYTNPLDFLTYDLINNRGDVIIQGEEEV